MRAVVGFVVVGLLVGGCSSGGAMDDDGVATTGSSSAASSASPSPTGATTSDDAAASLPAGAVLLQAGPDNDAALVPAAVAFLQLRLPEAQVSAQGGDIVLVFDGAAPADLAARVSQDAGVQWRPVLSGGVAADAPDGRDCTAPAPTLTVSEPSAELTTCAADGTAYAVLGPAPLSGGHVAEATLDGQTATVRLDALGTTALATLTGELVGKPTPADRLALVADGLVLLSAQVMNPITNGQSQFAGDTGPAVLGALMYGTPPMRFTLAAG